jgi:hypothetical protein
MLFTRCESSHAFLKKYLGGKKTRGTLYTAWQHMENAIRDRLQNIQTTADAERGRTPLELDGLLFEPVCGTVTWHALRLVVDNCRKAKLPLQPCTGTFTKAMGLPCAHVCDEKKDLGGLCAKDFDAHWFWDRTNIHKPHLEPRRVRVDKRLHNQPQSKTGRILSSFEIV